MRKLHHILIHKKIFVALLLLAVPIFFWILSLQSKDKLPIGTNPTPNFPTITPVMSLQDIEITEVYPADGTRDVDQNSIIRLTFADAFPKNVSLTLIPDVKGEYVRQEDQHIIDFIPSQSFRPQTQYTISLSIDNRPFLTPDKESTSVYQWTFLTGEQQGESGMTDEEIEEMVRIREQADKEYLERKQRLPFITSLPYQTSRFKVEIAATSDTVTITTFGTHRDYHTAYRQEALEWIRSKGGNPDTITIRYNPATL